jgi:hypothetical protein
MKVLVCGSRTWNDLETIANVIGKLPSGSEIIHGDALGADRMAGAAAAEIAGLKVTKFPISSEEWEKFGKAAGPRRNKKMLDESHPNLVIAFLDENSKTGGTRNMIELAESYGYRVVVLKLVR